MLRIEKLSVQLQGQSLLTDISFSLNKGETLCILGESGSGKSTLARAIMGLLPLSAGKISLNDKTLLSSYRRKAKDLIGQLVMQDPIAALNPRRTIQQSLTEALYRRKLTSEETQLALEAVLSLVELSSDFLTRYPRQLSLGQAQRVSIARALLANPEFIIFDEPLSALDAIVQKKVAILLDKLKQQEDLSYIFITHDLGFAECYADQILLLHRGEIQEFQTAENFFSAPKSNYGRKLLEAASSLGALNPELNRGERAA